MFISKLFFVHFVCTTIVLGNSDNDVYFIINAPESTTQTIPVLPPGYIYHSDIKNAYKIYTHRLNWTSARDACKSEGARIAVIDTEKKLEYIKNIRPWRNWVWTGIYRESIKENWRTVHGGPISPDVPRLYHSPLIIGNCIAVSGLNYSTRLNVLSCDSTRRFVCEIPDEE